MARVNIRDDALTQTLPAGAGLYGRGSESDPAPTLYSREAILLYIESALAGVASSGSASDLTSGTLPSGRLHAWLADISEIQAPAEGHVIYFDGAGFVSGPIADAVVDPLVDSDIGVSVQAHDAQLDEWATVDPSENGKSLVAAANYAAMVALLGLTIGTNVQAYSARLTDIAGLTATDGNIIVGNGTTWVAESGATARSSLGLGTGDSPTFASITTTNAGLAARFVNTTDAASFLEVARFEGDRATPGDGDGMQIGFYLSNDAGEQVEAARMTWALSDVSDGSEDSALFWMLQTGGSGENFLRLDPDALSPASNGILDLGTSSLRWGALHLTSGAYASLPAAATAGAGAIRYVTDAPGGDAVVKSDGAAWKSLLEATTTSGLLISTLGSSSDPDWLYTDFTGLGDQHSSVVIGVGNTDGVTPTTFSRVTVLGAHALQEPDTANRVEAFGNGALRWALNPERVTAIGSLVMQWLGRDPTELETLHHDFWDPVTNSGLVPGDVGWDWNGLETRNPGIGALIAAVTGAANADETEGNVGLGRDALVELIKGVYNTSGGYKSLQSLYHGSYNSAWGYYAGRDLVIADHNTFSGYSSGHHLQQGDYNLISGSRAAEDLVRSTGSVVLGPKALSDGWTDTDYSVVLGHEAGMGITPYDEALIVQNKSTNTPALLGDFAAKKLGLWVPSGSTVGAALHVYSALSDPALKVTNTGTGNSLHIEDASGDATPFIVDPNGTLVVGTTQRYTGYFDQSGTTRTPQFQMHGGSLSTTGMNATLWANTTSGPGVVLAKSRNATIGTHAAVSSGDNLGLLLGLGSDGTNFITGAGIYFQCDGTAGTNDMPGRIAFATTADGASTPTIRLILDSSGVLKPNTNDGVPLGTGALSFSDLFLASGAVVNFNNGDVTVTHSADTLAFNGGNWVFGHTAATTTAGIVPQFQLHGTSAATATFSNLRWSNNAGGAGQTLGKSRGGSIGTHTVVQSGDTLGFYNAVGSDGTNFIGAGTVNFEVDGTPGTNDMPGRIVLYTTPDGSTTPTESLRVSQNGAIAFSRVSTTASAANAFLDSGSSPANNLLRSTSSAKYKTQVEDLEPEYAARLLQARPVWYRSLATADRRDWSWYGLIAEELAEIDPRLVHYAYQDEDFEDAKVVLDDSGRRVARRVLKKGATKKPDGVQYERLTVLLLSLVQSLTRRVDALEAA